MWFLWGGLFGFFGFVLCFKTLTYIQRAGAKKISKPKKGSKQNRSVTEQKTQLIFLCQGVTCNNHLHIVLPHFLYSLQFHCYSVGIKGRAGERCPNLGSFVCLLVCLFVSRQIQMLSVGNLEWVLSICRTPNHPKVLNTFYFHVRHDFCQECVVPLHATFFINSVNISTYHCKED